VAVSVRLFAALREAAGTGEVLAAPGPLPQLLGDLCAEHGERFARVLGISSVLLDGTSVPRDADLAVPDGAELALLPPVSGGAAARRTGDLASRSDTGRRSSSRPGDGGAVVFTLGLAFLTDSA
jgi:molybdopterin converting factor small subunit